MIINNYQDAETYKSKYPDVAAQKLDHNGEEHTIKFVFIAPK